MSPSHAALLKHVQSLSPEQREKLLRLSVPRIVDEYMVHIPHPKQQVFMSLAHREAMFGGAAGGGKSDALLMAASQYVDVPGYSALILRRTWPDLNAAGAILDRARSWWKGTRAVEREGGRVWYFPTKDKNGEESKPARISFGYLQHDNDKLKFQSAEYQFVGFDELTQFGENQYKYLFSRIRRPQVSCLSCGQAMTYKVNKFVHAPRKKGLLLKPCDDPYPDPKILVEYPEASDGMSVFDIPLRMRSATNPGGPGHDWVRNRFIDPKTREPSAVFVPSLLSDNPSLDQESYEENLQHLTPVDRERLLGGDWDVVEEGDMFARHNFEVIQAEPVQGRQVRWWDNAATSGGGDFTVGARCKILPDGRFVICDIVRGQWGTREKEGMMRATAAADGPGVRQWMEQEPGSSGVDIIHHMRTGPFLGYNFNAVRSTGSKEDRAYPLSAHAKSGNVAIVAAPWNTKFLDEAALFPNGANDDQIDATSHAFNFLTRGGSKIIV